VRKLLLIGVVLIAILQAFQHREFLGNSGQQAPDSPPAPSNSAPARRADDDSLASAIEHRTSNVQVTGGGVVVRVLPDDNEGSRHQRFIVRVESDATVLIAHNIDLAPRIEDLRAGDRVEFSSEYEWNNKGGVIHWTHPDPAGRHVAGWIRKTAR
jgi:hypothetical protein